MIHIDSKIFSFRRCPERWRNCWSISGKTRRLLFYCDPCHHWPFILKALIDIQYVKIRLESSTIFAVISFFKIIFTYVKVKLKSSSAAFLFITWSVYLLKRTSIHSFTACQISFLNFFFFQISLFTFLQKIVSKITKITNPAFGCSNCDDIHDNQCNF